MDMCSNLIPLSSRQACMHAAAADETNYVAVWSPCRANMHAAAAEETKGNDMQGIEPHNN
jgi:hypothetical protein